MQSHCGRHGEKKTVVILYHHFFLIITSVSAVVNLRADAGSGIKGNCNEESTHFEFKHLGIKKASIICFIPLQEWQP